MKTFIEDIKILYPILIKEMIKMYLIICIITWVADMIFLVKSPFKFYHCWVAFGLVFIAVFLVVYFNEYRKVLAEIRKEVELEQKYNKLYNKFINRK
ncbi:hypothetical protein ABEV41_00545 [Geobacillus thermodenitrificans]|uniref:hypothetical protein n=1 Tax=Geobacillus thermodenitrificans TaxID=33940 RepID=UPI003D1A392E